MAVFPVQVPFPELTSRSSVRTLRGKRLFLDKVESVPVCGSSIRAGRTDPCRRSLRLTISKSNSQSASHDFYRDDHRIPIEPPKPELSANKAANCEAGPITRLDHLNRTFGRALALRSPRRRLHRHPRSTSATTTKPFREPPTISYLYSLRCPSPQPSEASPPASGPPPRFHLVPGHIYAFQS